TSNTDRDFIYGDNNRLKRAELLGVPVATYLYNGKGERVLKESQTTTLYFYTQNGMLIAETDESGTAQREYIYIDGVPFAMVTADNGSGSSGGEPIDFIIDNTSHQVSYFGNWPSSTVV